MIDQCVIETVKGGFPEVNKYVHASCLGENEKRRGVEPTSVLTALLESPNWLIFGEKIFYFLTLPPIIMEINNGMFPIVVSFRIK